MKGGLTGSEIRPALTLLETDSETVPVAFDDFAYGRTLVRHVPVRRVALADGSVATITTVYDLLMGAIRGRSRARR